MKDYKRNVSDNIDDPKKGRFEIANAFHSHNQAHQVRETRYKDFSTLYNKLPLTYGKIKGKTKEQYISELEKEKEKPKKKVVKKAPKKAVVKAAPKVGSAGYVANYNDLSKEEQMKILLNQTVKPSIKKQKDYQEISQDFYDQINTILSKSSSRAIKKLLDFGLSSEELTELFSGSKKGRKERERRDLVG